MSWSKKNIEILSLEALKHVFDHVDVTHVISLIHETNLDDTKQAIPESVTHHVEFFSDVDHADLPYIPDSTTPPAKKHVENVLEFVENNCNSESRIIVHCVRGEGRSPAIAFALLIKSGMSEIDALETIIDKAYPVWPNNLVLDHVDSIFNTDSLSLMREWKQHVAKIGYSDHSKETVMENFNSFKEKRNE